MPLDKIYQNCEENFKSACQKGELSKIEEALANIEKDYPHKLVAAINSGIILGKLNKWPPATLTYLESHPQRLKNQRARQNASVLTPCEPGASRLPMIPEQKPTHTADSSWHLPTPES